MAPTRAYEGVPLREILQQRAGAPLGKELRGKALAGYVSKAADGYEVVFSLGELDQAFGNLSIPSPEKRDGNR